MAAAEGDQTITGYRDHGHMLACGMDPKAVMAELTGRRSGASQGKGGSMHMFSKAKHFYGGHGIVGAQVPIGSGLAFANNYRGNGNICFTYFGDGAANQGQVYESFNMAELWKLPVVYIIENNRYAMGTSVTRSSALTDFSKRGQSFNIPGEQVDGMDVRAVKSAAARAAEWCRSRQWPDDPRNADLPLSRPFDVGPGEIPLEGRSAKNARGARPDRTGPRALIGSKQVAEDDLKKIDAEVRTIIAEAAEFASHEPEPDAAELWTDVLGELKIIGQIEPYKTRTGDGDEYFDARAFADDGTRQAHEMAKKRR